MAFDLADVSLRSSGASLRSWTQGSFAEAGRWLGLSPSVVSKTMARLEAAHGVKLLHRSTHSVSPIEEGRALVVSARAAVAALQDVVGVLDHFGSGAGGTVRLTAPIAFLHHCLLPMLPELRGTLPDTRLDLRASNEFLDLASHGIDLAIRSGSLDDVPGHVRHVWFTCPWVVCATPGYLAGRALPTTPVQLKDHELIGFRASEDGLVRGWHFRDPETGTRSRLVPDPVLAFDDGEAGWLATLAGLGIARAPLFLAAEGLREGTVVELLRPWRDADMPVSIVRRESRLTPPRVERLIAFLKRHPPRLDVA